jgi:hypothetical protein
MIRDPIDLDLALLTMLMKAAHESTIEQSNAPSD